MKIKHIETRQESRRRSTNTQVLVQIKVAVPVVTPITPWEGSIPSIHFQPVNAIPTPNQKTPFSHLICSLWKILHGILQTRYWITFAPSFRHFLDLR